MGISVVDQFNYQGQKFNFERDAFKTLAEMKAYPETSLPPKGFEAYCEETEKKYEFNVSNSVDPITGKWREVESGEASNVEILDLFNISLMSSQEEILQAIGRSPKQLIEELKTKKFFALGRFSDEFSTIGEDGAPIAAPVEIIKIIKSIEDDNGNQLEEGKLYLCCKTDTINEYQLEKNPNKYDAFYIEIDYENDEWQYWHPFRDFNLRVCTFKSLIVGESANSFELNLDENAIASGKLNIASMVLGDISLLTNSSTEDDVNKLFKHITYKGEPIDYNTFISEVFRIRNLSFQKSGNLEYVDSLNIGLVPASILDTEVIARKIIFEYVYDSILVKIEITNEPSFSVTRTKTNLFTDAPKDTNTYGRKNGTWTKIEETVKQVTWNNSSNLNDYKEEGIYQLSGIHSNSGDNMPITAYANGDIGGVLTVSVSTTDATTKEQIISQSLILGNRVGAETKQYLRSCIVKNGVENWTAWKEISTILYFGEKASGQATRADIDAAIDNGQYAGVYVDSDGFLPQGATFTLTVINNYAANASSSLPANNRQVTQVFVYTPLSTDGSVNKSVMCKRDGIGGDTISWSTLSDIQSSNNIYIIKSSLLNEKSDVETITNALGSVNAFKAAYENNNIFLIVYSNGCKSVVNVTVNDSEVEISYIVNYVTSDSVNTILYKKFSYSGDSWTACTLTDFYEFAPHVEEAPEDSKIYGRKNGEWTSIESSSTTKGNIGDIVLPDKSLMSLEDYKSSGRSDAIGVVVDNVKKIYIEKPILDVCIDTNNTPYIYWTAVDQGSSDGRLVTSVILFPYKGTENVRMISYYLTDNKYIPSILELTNALITEKILESYKTINLDLLDEAALNSCDIILSSITKNGVTTIGCPIYFAGIKFDGNININYNSRVISDNKLKYSGFSLFSFYE